MLWKVAFFSLKNSSILPVSPFRCFSIRISAILVFSLSSLYLNQVQYRLNMLQYRKSLLRIQTDPEALRSVENEISQILKIYQQVLDGKGDTSLATADPLEYLKTLKLSYGSLLRDRERLRSQASALENNIKKKGADLKYSPGKVSS